MDRLSHDERAERAERELRLERLQLLARLDAILDKPMLVLAFVWVGLLVAELSVGLPPVLEGLSLAIWAVFILDFVLEFVIAPAKIAYLRSSWLTAVSLLLPALRVLRVVPALRALRLVRLTRSTTLLRVITSVNRGMGALADGLGRRGFGYVLALTAVVMVVGAAGMAFFEAPGLASYADALWWTAMLMTTIGTDYWPVTPEGRILAWLLALYALAIFGYITATIATILLGRERGGVNADRRQGLAGTSTPPE